jgi:predicted aspartyl protease
MLIDANRVRGWGLKVLLNGHPSKLFLDTGASGILVSRKLAEKAKLVSVADTKIGGIGDKGLTGGHIAYADSIKVGDLEFQNCMVEISDKKEVADEDGLIGADVFERYLVDIDLANRKLRLSPLPKRPGESDTNAALKTSDDEDAEAAGAAPADKEKGDAATHNQTAAAAATQRVPQDGYIAPEMQSYTKVFRFGHELLIRTRVNESSPKLFLIDTGSQMTLISPDAAREVTKVHGENHVRVQGLNGNVRNVYSADKAVLQFSHLRQENDDIISFDLSNLSKHTGTEISGVLGFTTLGLLDMKIDYRDGLVDFSYDEARWRRFR